MHDDEDLPLGKDFIISGDAQDDKSDLLTSAIINKINSTVQDITTTRGTTTILEVSSTAVTESTRAELEVTYATHVRVVKPVGIVATGSVGGRDQSVSNEPWDAGGMDDIFSYYTIVGVLVLILMVLAIGIVIGIFRKEQLLKKQENITQLLGQLDKEQQIVKQNQRRSHPSYDCTIDMGTCENCAILRSSADKPDPAEEVRLDIKSDSTE